MFQNAFPALLLLALMVGIAFALKWARGRVPGLAGVPGQHGPALRVLSSLPLGPQQRVVTLQVGQGEGATCLVIGVAPGSVQTLHSLPLPPGTDMPAPGAAPGGFAARLAQLTAPKKGPGDGAR